MNELSQAAGRAGWIAVVLAVAASLALLWVVVGDPVPVVAFATGLLGLGVPAIWLARRRPREAEQVVSLPDWSVTVAAIERPDTAIAIADRAGRLVCANTLFDEWFGTAHAPPSLPVDKASLQLLARAARQAWQNGKGSIHLLETDDRSASGQRWSGEVVRAGRGEDFLVWQFSPIVNADPVSELAEHLDGKLGRALANAGIAAAVVDPDGVIRAASAGFAQKATGDSGANLAGREFVTFLQQNEGDRISWAREDAPNSALMLYYLPVADPDLPIDADTDAMPSLMVLVDAGLGVGGSASEASAAVPHLEALLSELPLGLAMADRDGRLLFANSAFMRAVGREGEKPPTYPTDFVTREDKRALSEAIRRFARGPATSGDISIRLAAQPEESVSLSLAGMRGLGEAAVLLGLTDSTEEIRLKRQVAQATKMQAVGQLAGGVAHDFNNVLTAILGTCDLMLMRHTPGDSDYDDIQQIRANSNRAASLTRQLLAFSRQQTLRPELLQLPDVVSDISQMLRRLLGEKIELVVTHDRDLGPVRADPTQLEQVIVNLAVNARDAMLASREAPNSDASGKLTLSTKRITPADVLAMGSEILPVGEYTALIVKDTGSGIPPEHLGKIFEPFFTTKEKGRGTGLGLSTVYGIVKQSGGFIFADSELGRGTTFTVYLPVHHGDVETYAAPPLPEAPSEWAGGGRILLVEDEEPVRMVAQRALARQGYEVTVAPDGEEGLALVTDGWEFDLVVTDVVMPSMDGPEMARQIRKLAPAMPVLFMSGYAEEQLRNEIDIKNMYFIPKPFSVQQISEKVGDVLGSPAQ